MNNTLLVLGNGFDIYNKMKTNFSDYLEYEFKKIENNYDLEEDSFMDMFHHSFLRTKKNKVNENMSTEEEERNFKKISKILNYNLLLFFLIYIFKIERKCNDYSLIIKNENWNDIENFIGEIFKSLDLILFKKKNIKNKNFQQIIETLNSFISHLRVDINKAQKDIKERMENWWGDIAERFSEYLKIESENISTHKSFEKFINNKRENIKISNFNFTDTIFKYLSKKTNINYIHGNIKKNNIVLGINNISYESNFAKLNKKLNKYIKEIPYVNLKNLYNENILELEIIIFGHSIAKQDHYFFKQLIEFIKNREEIMNSPTSINGRRIRSDFLNKKIKLKWNIICKDKNDIEDKKRNLLILDEEYFINNENVEFISLKNSSWFKK